MAVRMRDVGRVLVLAAVYVVFARLGLSFAAIAGFATVIWAPSGIAIAALLILGFAIWPGILLGAFAANLLAGAPVAVALGIASGNTAEALACLYLLRRIRHFALALDEVRSVTQLVLAAVLGTIVSATIGTAYLYAGGILDPPRVRVAWQFWWIGDMVGVLLIAPVILVWSEASRARFARSRLEVAALAVTLALVCFATFFGDVPLVAGPSTPFHQADLLLAVLMWATLRFGQRGAVTAVFCVSVAALAATMLGHGPFRRAAMPESLISLQTFVAIVAVTFLLFGATIDELRCSFESARAAFRSAALANRAKSEFLAVMSHELRTPLNAIAGYAQLLEAGVYGPLTEKQLEGVTRIQRGERRLLSLVDEVLGFVSAEKGRVTLRREPIRVSDAFDAVQPIMASQLAEHHCTLERRLDGQQLAVTADPVSLQQTLQRLVSNAAKFSRDGGTVTLGAERAGAGVRIWIRDSGVGIPHEVIERVFDPFFQAEHSTTRRYAGIGLGLSIARSLARQMGGEVTLSSELGRGTTAFVRLPSA